MTIATFRRVSDNRINLRRLEILCLVVETGLVSRVAEQLGVAKSVISNQLQQLEEQLQVEVFQRHGRTLELTDDGAVVYAWAVETLARGRAMIRELRGGNDPSRGAAVVGASMSIGSYILPSLFLEFRRERPAAELSMVVCEAAEAIDGVERGDLDFGVVVLDTVPSNPALVAEHLCDEPIVLVTAPDGRPDAASIPISELDTIPIVSPLRGSHRRQLLDRVVGAYRHSVPDAGLEVGHPEAAKRAVLEGMGATLITRSAVAEDLASGRLREVTIADARLAYPIYSLRRANKNLSPLQEDLLRVIRTRLTANHRPRRTHRP